MTVIKVSFYGSPQELNQVDELKKSESLVLVPSPQIADGIRSLLSSDAEVFTISNWVSGSLKQKQLTRTNKSQLMLRLSSVWRNYFPHGELNVFLRSFEIFTEMRSFTLELDLLGEFVKELDEEMAKSIFIFWAFLQSEKLIDEHMSYKLAGATELGKALHIIGFRHMSGVQIDMLKEISHYEDVTIYFPREVYKESHSGDWIRWFTNERFESPENIVKTIETLVFPSNRLNSVIAELEGHFGNFDVCLAQQQSDFHSIQEVIRPKQYFKSTLDLFSSSVAIVLDELEKFLNKGSMPVGTVLEFIQKRKNEILKEEMYLQFKVWNMYSEAFNSYKEFQENIDTFALMVTSQIVQLNAPRVSLASLDLESESRIVLLEELLYYRSSRKMVITASAKYGSLKGSDAQKSEKMLKALSAIGPIKRAGLDFSFTKYDLRSVLSNQNVLLVIEEGLEHIDLAWKEILSDFNTQNIQFSWNTEKREIRDLLSAEIVKTPVPIKKFSASRLQTYLDCPRKYYFSYIQKIEHRPESRSQLSPDEKGSIEHKAIEEYFKKYPFKDNKSLNVDLLGKCLDEVFNSFIVGSKIELSQKQKIIIHYELFNCVRNGVSYLLDYANEFSAENIKFEIAIPPNNLDVVGFIDCVVYLKDKKIGLFDFKRSTASIGSKKETLEFEKIQLWVYLLSQLNWSGNSIHHCGYLNLSELGESLIFKDTDKQPIEKAQLDKFEIYLASIINQLVLENKYEARPRKESICNFCEVSLYCTKGIRHEFN